MKSSQTGFYVNTEVRQGDGLFSMLFNLFIEDKLQELKKTEA